MSVQIVKRVLCGILIFALAAATSPEGVVLLNPAATPAFADLGADSQGGVSDIPGQKPSGVRIARKKKDDDSELNQPPGAAKKKKKKGPNQPGAKKKKGPNQPAAKKKGPNQPAAKKKGPNQPGAKKKKGPNQPTAKKKGPNQPAGKKKGPNQPGAKKKKGPNQPTAKKKWPGVGKPRHTGRPRFVRRPLGWRPPRSRPPHWRPPVVRPPYYRRPHVRYGAYHWNPNWGWFFTGAIVGSTLVYTDVLPSGRSCQRVIVGGETLFRCGRVLYRSTAYQGNRVYEIVSAPPSTVQAEPRTVIGLSLTSPMTRGRLVRDLQNRLVDAGYDVGAVDGVFGSETEAALMWFQSDNDLEPTGVVDVDTSAALGYNAVGRP